MAFCPECGKPVTAEASKCASCGHELEAKPAAAKGGAARFKGTMLMATSPVQKAVGAAASAASASSVASVDNGAGVKPAAAAPVATAPVAAAAAAAPAAAKAQAKATMIGTGLGAGAIAPAGVNRPANQAAAASPIASAAAAAVPNVSGAKPKATVLGAAPIAAAAAAHAAPAAAAPVAAAAAGAAAAAVQARAADPSKPDDPKKNLAFAQTQHHGAFTAASGAAQAAAPAAPRTSPNLGASPEGFDPHAETDPPDAPPSGYLGGASEASEDADANPESTKYLPGDPMAPQPVAARAPMLRYDDSMPRIARGGGDDKKWLWIAAGVIVVACLGLVIVLASRMGH